MTVEKKQKLTARAVAGKAAGLFVGSWTMFSPDKLLGLKDDDGKPTKGSYLASAWSELRSRYAIPVKGSARRETFRQATSRLGLNEEAVQKRRGELQIEARIFYVLCAIFLAIAFYYAGQGLTLSCVAGICASSMCFTSAWIKAFRVWQIDLKKLVTLSDFYATPSAWLV